MDLRIKYYLAKGYISIYISLDCSLCTIKNNKLVMKNNNYTYYRRKIDNYYYYTIQ